MPSPGCLSGVTGQAAQSVLRCSLINLLMRLYASAAHEAKEETFVIHAALQPHSSKDKNSQSFPLIFVISVTTSKAPLPLSTPESPSDPCCNKSSIFSMYTERCCPYHLPLHLHPTALNSLYYIRHSSSLFPKYFQYLFGLSFEITAQCSYKPFVFKGTQILCLYL